MITKILGTIFSVLIVFGLSLLLIPAIGIIIGLRGNVLGAGS
jgi:hypothetical protein